MQSNLTSARNHLALSCSPNAASRKARCQSDKGLAGSRNGGSTQEGVGGVEGPLRGSKARTEEQMESDKYVPTLLDGEDGARCRCRIGRDDDAAT